MSGNLTAYARAVLVWRWEDAPPRLQRLVSRPGTWLLVVPKGVDLPSWARVGQSDEWGRIQEVPLADGDRCVVAFAADRQVALPL